jgi:AAA domain-containing protein
MQIVRRSLIEGRIFDEAQTLPALFRALRSVIDEMRRRNGRFFPLGPVGPDLLKSISENLAGRVGTASMSDMMRAHQKPRLSCGVSALGGRNKVVSSS